MKLWSFIFAVAFCLVFTGYSLSAPAGLVLYLPFDEGSGTVVKDLSGNNNNGTLKGAPKWVKGKFGTALQFNGAENKNYVEVPDNASLNPATEITCAAWIYFDKFIGSGGVISKYIGANNQRGYSLRMDHTNALSVASDCSSDGTANAGKYTTASTPANMLKEGQWQHIATAFKAKQYLRLYVNGVLKGETATGVTDSLFDNTVPLLIGTDFLIGGAGNSGPREFTGIIDEVAIFNRALSDAEIQSLSGSSAITSVESNGKLAVTWGAMKSN